MRQTLILLLRHLMVWKRYFWLYVLYFTFQPLVLLYGMERALNQMDQLAFLTPGFMVYTAAASCLMGTAYNVYEQMMEGQIPSWLGANVSISEILGSHILLQCLRSVVSAGSVLVGGLVMMPAMPVHNLLAVFAVIFMLSLAVSMLGAVMAAKAGSINQIYISDTIIYAVFVFSGIFVATSTFPAPVQWVMWALPFWHAVELARPLFMGQALLPGHAALNVGVLSFYTVAGYGLAMLTLRQRLIT